MAVVDYYVDTASSSGGDGTTAATTGIHRAFANLNAALAALNTAYPNFVTSAVNPVIHCAASGGAADTTNISFPSFTSSSTYYLTIKDDSALTGIYDTSKYRVENNSITTFTNYPAYTRFVRLQVVNGADDNTLSVWGTGLMGAQGVVVDSCIARFKVMARSFGNTSTIFHGGTDQTGDPSIVRNCLFYDVFTNTNKGVCAITSVNGNVLVDNCTLIGPGSAADSTCAPVVDGYTRIKVRNTLVYNWAANGTHGTSDYNASDRSVAFGGAHDRVSQTFTFVDAATKKYQLASGDTGAKAYGEDLSADATDPYSTDITGTARTTPWDIGAFIAAAASGVAATGTAGQQEGASGSAGESIAVTGSAGSAAGAAGTAGEKVAATGSAGEQEGASGNAGEQVAATGSAGEQAGASGAAGEAIAATGSAGEAEGAAGNAGESIAATGSAGQEEGAQGTAGSSGGASIVGSAGQEEGAQGSAGEQIPATGAAGQSESAQGSAGERIAATGSGASAAGASGNAGEQIAASGSGAEQESAAGSAGESIAATGSAGEVESAAGAAGQTQPGAPTPVRVTRVYAGPTVRVTRVQAIPSVRVTRVSAFPS